MSFRVVPIAEEHVEGFWAALDGVARERRYLAFLEAPDLASVRHFVLGNLRAGNPQLVAIAGGTVVGWCDVVAGSREVFQHSGVLGMGVVEGFRGRGIGRALIEATLARAWERGLTRVELTVRCDNERARRLYERVGFAHEGRLRHHMRVDGAYHDADLMAIVLPSP